MLFASFFVVGFGGGGGRGEEGGILFVVEKKPVAYGEPFISPFSEFGEREEERNVWGKKKVCLVWCTLTD